MFQVPEKEVKPLDCYKGGLGGVDGPGHATVSMDGNSDADEARHCTAAVAC
jgi:hypothetical protein